MCLAETVSSERSQAQIDITLCLFTRGSLNIDVEAQSQLAEARQGSVETAQQHVGGRPTQLHRKDTF